jgi:hypothetical protein
VSTDISPRGAAGAPPPDAPGTLHVEAVFRDVPERRAHEIAAELIDRAHELANMPDSECDVDVSVKLEADGDAVGSDRAR